MSGLKAAFSLFIVLIGLSGGFTPVDAYEIGVFYFPGWNSSSRFWKDIKGEPGSRSPGIAWPDREPLLGYYPEEEVWVAEKHIDWASSHGIDFFAYDWYWYGKNPDTEHAQQAFFQAKNRSKLKFCLLWANHSEVPRTVREFDDMVDYWINRYFKEPDYYRIDGKPVIFIFSLDWFGRQAMGLRQTPRLLLQRASAKARLHGHPGIYFIATTDERPGSSLEKRYLENGFDAYTGWNYVRADGLRIADYNSMVDTYLSYYREAAKTSNLLPYIVPASPGYDDRPWYGDKATVRTDPTPEKFERMLRAAKGLLDGQKNGPGILMIESWNEFAEGSYIEPTKKWGSRYLGAIGRTFAP